MAVLLLQGPLGPFFQTLAGRLQQERETVYRVVFNGGDSHYGDDRVICYRGKAGKQWQDYLTNLIKSLDVHAVLVYDEYRVYHAEAKRICQRQGVPYCVFDEGYLRPNYITLKVADATAPLRVADLQSISPVHAIPDEQVVGGDFMSRAWFAARYYVAASAQRLGFRSYLHHRSLSPVYEGFCWLRSGLRKQLYRVTQRDALARICAEDFFLVPLQVFNDAQLLHHSRFSSIGQFIREVLESYKASSVSARLVFKHHPMDRGHVHYARLIREISTQLGIGERVDYVHDLHLPTLLKHTAGVVTINSTTALQAFYHHAPVKVLGNAFFDLPGLTDQQTLADFWHVPQAPDETLADRLRHYLVSNGQINGSFYSQLPMTLNHLVPHLRDLGVIRSKPQPSWCGFRGRG